jgi:hypothetical protein
MECLLLGMFCGWYFWAEDVFSWNVLYLEPLAVGMFCSLGRYVAWDVVCLRRFVLLLRFAVFV